MQIVQDLAQALFTAFSMFWEILWPLILGFTLSGIVQAVVFLVGVEVRSCRGESGGFAFGCLVDVQSMLAWG